MYAVQIREFKATIEEYQMKVDSVSDGFTKKRYEALIQKCKKSIKSLTKKSTKKPHCA